MILNQPDIFNGKILIINKPEKVWHENKITYQCLIDSFEGSQTLWYRVDKEFSHFLTELSDGPLVALIIPAMMKGDDIKVVGPVSERLLFNLAGPYQKILKLVIPSLHFINIKADIIQSTSKRATGVATGFSCGIDSYCVLADHYFNNVTNGFKLTHLIFNNVGSHLSGKENNYMDGGRHLFEKRYLRIKTVAEKFNLPVIKVSSNLGYFYPNFSFQQTHTLRNSSVPLILQEGIGRFLYATGYNNSEVFVGPSTAIDHIDPITLSYLSTETVDMISVGGEYSRVDKTIKVAELSDSHNTLDVCIRALSDNVNCSRCRKCMRTLLTLDIAGLLNLYRNSFDLDVYQKEKDKFIGEVIKNSHPIIAKFKKHKDPLLLEINQFAKEQNYSFRIKSYLWAILANKFLLRFFHKVRNFVIHNLVK